MGYSEMMEILQKRHKDQIVLCRNGNFYIAIGKDAILLNKILGSCQDQCVNFLILFLQK